MGFAASATFNKPTATAIPAIAAPAIFNAFGSNAPANFAIPSKTGKMYFAIPFPHERVDHPGHVLRDRVQRWDEDSAGGLREIPEGHPELVPRGGLRRSGTPELARQFLQDDLLCAHLVAGLHERRDLVLLLIGQLHTDSTQRRSALHRVLERLADLDRGGLQRLPQRHGHIRDRLRRTIKDLVALARLVADIRERQEQVLTGLDRLIIDPRLLADRASEILDLLARDLRDAAGGLDRRVGLRRRLLRLPVLRADGVNRNS
jgi:hypothetical protein